MASRSRAGGAVGTEYAPSLGLDEAPPIAARFWDEDDMRALRLMTDAAHEHGHRGPSCHGGAHIANNQTRVPAVAPSQLASDLEAHVVPKEMEETSSASSEDGRRGGPARDCGFDIVYVYGAHAYLPMQFLSLLQQADGHARRCAKDRARFWLENIEAVRGAVGTDCTTATRIAVDALGPAGIHLDEALEFVDFADDVVDLWDVNVGSIAFWSKDSGTSRYFEEGYQLEWTGDA